MPISQRLRVALVPALLAVAIGLTTAVPAAAAAPQGFPVLCKRVVSAHNHDAAAMARGIPLKLDPAKPVGLWCRSVLVSGVANFCATAPHANYHLILGNRPDGHECSLPPGNYR